MNFIISKYKAVVFWIIRRRTQYNLLPAPSFLLSWSYRWGNKLDFMLINFHYSFMRHLYLLFWIQINLDKAPVWYCFGLWFFDHVSLRSINYHFYWILINAWFIIFIPLASLIHQLQLLFQNAFRNNLFLLVILRFFQFFNVLIDFIRIVRGDRFISRRMMWEMLQIRGVLVFWLIIYFHFFKR